MATDKDPETPKGIIDALYDCGDGDPPKRLVERAIKEAHALGREQGFIAAIEECAVYSKTVAKTEEAKAVALHLAVRIAQRKKKEEGK